MLDINLIRENPDVVRESLRNRQMDPAPVDDVLKLDVDRRGLLSEVETLKAERNKASKEISQIKDKDERQAKIDAMRQVGDQIAELDGRVHDVETTLQDIVASIPNLLDSRTPYGTGEQDNKVVETEGK